MKQRLPSLFFVSWLSLQSRHGVAFSRTAVSTTKKETASRIVHKTFPMIPLHDTLPVSISRLYSSNNLKPDDGLVSRAEEAFSILAKRNRTWKRLRHLVDLAQTVKSTANTTGLPCNTIVDIGTDHGILPIALAATGQFGKVTGIDISEQVLENGARETYREVQDHLKLESDLALPLVNFVCGNGLAEICRGDADIVCIAGMGVNTMLQIIMAPETDQIDCGVLLLQPTNSKPRNLIHLYDTLQQDGWILLDERIETLSSRWYISAAFVRGEDKQNQGLDHHVLPGTKLLTAHDNESKSIFDDYTQHHATWMASDQQFGKLHESEQRWLLKFCPNN